MPRDEIPGLRAAQLRLGRLPGYVRRPDLARRNSADGHTYKKGWEVRFTARTEAEIAEIRDLVTAAGFAPARPFFKGHQLIQPVYGIAAVQAYIAAREAVEEIARARNGEPAEPAPGHDDTGPPTGCGGGGDNGVEACCGTAFPAQTRREAAAPVAAAAAAAAAAGAAAAAAAARVETESGSGAAPFDRAGGKPGRRTADKPVIRAGRTS